VCKREDADDKKGVDEAPITSSQKRRKKEIRHQGVASTDEGRRIPKERLEGKLGFQLVG